MGYLDCIKYGVIVSRERKRNNFKTHHDLLRQIKKFGMASMRWVAGQSCKKRKDLSQVFSSFRPNTSYSTMNKTVDPVHKRA